MSQTFREASRKTWNANDVPEISQINSGALQRIADACESMAIDHRRLTSDLEYYKQRCNEMRERNKTLLNRLRAVRGVVTKLQKKLKPEVKS